MGLPLTQLPEAVALESLTPSSGLGGGGSSAASACVMSTSPMPGTGIVVVGIGAEPEGTPTDRLATSPVAPAVCCAGWVAEPSSVVRADMTLACSGSGSAGRLTPPLAALHVVCAHVGRDRRTDGLARSARWPSSSSRPLTRKPT